MCKNWLLFVLTLCLTTISVEKLAGQSPNHLRYFTDVDRMYEAKESQALYVESQLVLADSSIAIEVTRIKDQQIVRYELYQDGFPFGAWQYFDEDLNKNLFVHYPYEVAYTDELYDNEIYFDFRRALNGEKEFDGFEAPRLKTSNSFYHCVGSQIVYPEFSRRNGHEGTVWVQIKIHSEGQPEFISINSGIEDHLDKESVRVILRCGLWEPAILDGKKIDSYTIIPIAYILK